MINKHVYIFSRIIVIAASNVNVMILINIVKVHSKDLKFFLLLFFYFFLFVVLRPQLWPLLCA